MKRLDALFIDVDSCLCSIEGIDELARMRGLNGEISSLTRRAMAGDIPFEEVFAKRLSMIKPLKKDIDALSRLYIHSLTPFAVETIRQVQRSGIHVYLLSGGYREALRPLAIYLDIDPEHIIANSLRFNEDGEYIGFDRENPLTRQEGKRVHIERIKKEKGYKRVGLVGDSATDAVTRPVVEHLICFAGYHDNQIMIEASDTVIYKRSFRILYNQKKGR